MKKTLTILSAIIFLLLSFKAKAQDDKPPIKSYLSFTSGASFPIGDFGKSDYSNNSAGFAKRGATLGLDAGIHLYKNLSLGLAVAFNDQGELNPADAQNLSNGYSNSFQKDQTSVTGVNRYHNFSFMGGPQYSFMIKSFILDFRVSAGVIKSVSTPDITVDFDATTSDAITLEQLNSTGLTFAYGASGAVRYSFSDNWDVCFKVNYINGTGINISNTGHPDDTTGRIVNTQPISVLQTTVGLALRF